MKLIFSFLVLLSISSCAKNSFDSLLDEKGLPLNFKGRYELVSQNEDPVVIVGEEKTKESLIKIKYGSPSSLEEAHKEIKSALVRLVSQYQFTMAPYPGQLTTIANCGKEFLPKLVREEWGAVIYAFANERMALTICQGDEVFYKYSQSFFWDEVNKRLVSLEIYQKKEKEGDLNLLFDKTHMVRLTKIDLERYLPLFKF